MWMGAFREVNLVELGFLRPKWEEFSL